MNQRYQIVIEYDGPMINEYGFSPTIAEMTVKKSITEYLNRCDGFRREQLAKIYNVSATNTSRIM